MTVRIKSTGKQGNGYPQEDGTVRVVLDGGSYFKPDVVFVPPSELEMQRVVCPDCGKPTLRDGMYSEDFASVFDQKCSACGARHYVYIGAGDSPRSWEAFRTKYQKTWIPYA